VRKRMRSSRSTGGTRKSAAPDHAREPAQRVQPPLVEQFHVAVDRQLKSAHETYTAAEAAALAIKTRYPQLQVTIYDAKEHRHASIEQPEAGAKSEPRIV